MINVYVSILIHFST